jgi:hypothetical protein
LVLWPFACAVYNDDTLGLGLGGGAPLDNGAGGTSAGISGSGGNASTSNTGGTSAAHAGNATRGGTAAESLAGSGGSSDRPAIGGDGSADGGEASGGGTSGSAGTSGSDASSGGKGGANGGSGGAPTTAGTGGNGGSAGGGAGGGPSIPLCGDHPLTARATWTATASHPTSGDMPANLLDGKVTRWSTGKAQSGDEWLQIDFGAAVTFNHVNLQQGDDTNDYPRNYSVIVSNAAKDLSGTVRGTGSGKSGVSTAILLPALATGRYLLIRQTATSLSWWSAEEIEVSCSD